MARRQNRHPDRDATEAIVGQNSNPSNSHNLKRFAGELEELFGGRSDCFGLYFLEALAPNPGKKREGKAYSYPNKNHPDRILTKDDWINHCIGTAALGIVPVHVDGRTKWFAIDVDDYQLDHEALRKKIQAKAIPLVHCRSKSGGAHLYGLLTEPHPADECVKLARKWVGELGFDVKRTEVFPKQTKFDSPEAKGNWIIIPYFGGATAEDFAFDDEGKKVDSHSFYALAKAKMMTPADVKDLLKADGKKSWSFDDILEQSPPCIRAMMVNMVKEGEGRNNALCHLSWYYQKLDAFFETGDWKDKLAEFNSNYFDPPVSFSELSQVIKNHSKGKYKARCDNNPMAHYCDRDTCLKLKFGIGKDASYYGDVQISGITKIETGNDPFWKVYANGKNMVVDTDTLQNPRKFRIALLAVCNILIPPIKQAEHDAIIGPIIANALIIETADILSNATKVENCLHQWISIVGDKSADIETVSRGIPYIDRSDKTIIFRLQDFVLEYRRVHKELTSDKEIYMCLQALGCAQFTKKIGSINMSNLIQVKFGEGDEWVPEGKTEGQF